MKSSLLKIAAFAVLACSGFVTAAHATTLGYGTSAAGNALWDTFSTISFTNRAADSVSGSAFTGLTLASDLAGGSVPAGNDRLYSGVGPTANAHDLTLGGTAATAITTFTLQIKYTTPSGFTLGASNVGDFFTISSNFGSSPAAFVLGTSNEGGQNVFNIVSWTWTGLDLTTSSPFTIEINSTANHVSIDGLRIDAGAVSVVPEPSAFAALAGLGALGFATLRRRRA